MGCVAVGPVRTMQVMNSSPASESYVSKMVAAYRSKVLSEAQTSRWLPRLKELVVAAEPCSTKKVTLYLAAGCRFLADMSDTGEESVDELLCDAMVARWSHRFGSQCRTDSTLGNYLGSLNRLVDTKKGLPTQRRTRRLAQLVWRPRCRWARWPRSSLPCLPWTLLWRPRW